MKFDVPTFNSISLMVFACGAIVTITLSRIFPHVKPLRFWTAGFILMCGSVMSYATHAELHRDWLLVVAATLNLQYRILTWSGVRVLFGASARLRTGFAVCVGFCLLYSIAFALRLPKIYLAGLVALFFVPFRALTVYEVCKRQRQHLGLGRALVAPGSFILALNAVAPLVLVLLDGGASPMLIGTPPIATGFYFVVFAGDLLVVVGLIVLAMQQIITEKNIFARLDNATLRISKSMLAVPGGEVKRGETETLDPA
ncbi:hypothetical protein PQQ96_01905 [Paraburkholderia sediminicola]|uniref:hypothetical protein n=1 Tax=Paraburkholderia sediminicola TaxID=458836 RepID=UPI0038BB97F9